MRRPGYVSGVNQSDKTPYVVQVEIVEKDEPEKKTRCRDLAQLFVAVLIASGIAVVISCQTPAEYATPVQYFTGLAGGAVFYAAFAAIAKALQLVWPDAGFKISEQVMIAAGAAWTALVALTRISVLGVGA